jgi:hypothetical protein
MIVLLSPFWVPASQEAGGAPACPGLARALIAHARALLPEPAAH